MLTIKQLESAYEHAVLNRIAYENSYYRRKESDTATGEQIGAAWAAYEDRLQKEKRFWERLKKAKEIAVS